MRRWRDMVMAPMILAHTVVWVWRALVAQDVFPPSPAAAAARIDPKEIVAVLPKDAVPAISQATPLFVTAEAVTGVRHRAQVLGVALGGESRAYPVAFLSWHEIVNDMISGVPIAVTWCPLCYTGIVYARELHGQVLTFGVSGKLWANGPIMYDHQTDSLWSQVAGQAITGPMQGRQLQMLPVTQTDWTTWKQLHPTTLVLDPNKSPHQRDYSADPYEGYYDSRDIGVSAMRRQDARLNPKAVVLGLRLGDAVKAYPFRHLSKEPVVNDTVAVTPVVVVFREKNATGLVFDRRVDEHVLTFHMGENDAGGWMTMRDEQTGTLWSAFAGIAQEGPLAGKQLQRLPATYAFWFAWKDYYPETAVFKEEREAIESKPWSP